MRNPPLHLTFQAPSCAGDKWPKRPSRTRTFPHKSWFGRCFSIQAKNSSPLLHPLSPSLLSWKIVPVDWGDFTTSEHITCLSKLTVSQPIPNTASQIFFRTILQAPVRIPHLPNSYLGINTQKPKVIFSKYSSGYTPCCPEPKGRCLQYVDGALLDLLECLVLRYQSRIRHTQVWF